MQTRVAALALVGLLLAACTPADAELDGDLVIAGMEPAFWGVKVMRAENKAVISILGEADFTGAAPTKSPGEDGAFNLSTTTAGGDFVMVLRQQKCLDGLDNGVEYQWAVTVSWNGETLQGCARAG